MVSRFDTSRDLYKFSLAISSSNIARHLYIESWPVMVLWDISH